MLNEYVRIAPDTWYDVVMRQDNLYLVIWREIWTAKMDAEQKNPWSITHKLWTCLLNPRCQHPPPYDMCGPTNRSLSQSPIVRTTVGKPCLSLLSSINMTRCIHTSRDLMNRACKFIPIWCQQNTLKDIHLNIVAPYSYCSTYIHVQEVYKVAYISTATYLYTPWVLQLSDFVTFNDDQHPSWDRINPVVRAIDVSHAASKDKFRRNPRSHSWRFQVWYGPMW